MAATILDPRFGACLVPGAEVEKLWTGGRWIEGPAWLADRRELVFSDIPNNRMLCWNEATSETRVFREPSASANGNTIDREGRLVTCEQATRRITRTEADGSITALADRVNGQRFTAPNDIVVARDGSVWFTDPDYGKSPVYEGEAEIDGCHVYRIAPDGAVTQMTNDMVMPNGLAFSPDETLLYVADTGSTHVKGGPNHIRRFAVGADGSLSGGEVFATDPALGFDGFRVDTEGRLWCGAMDGIHCYHLDGTMLGRIAIPERVGNLTFGGTSGRDLLICGSTSLYSYRVNARNASR